MKKQELISLIKEEIKRVLKEERGPTEFEFDPLKFKGRNIVIKQGKEYIYSTPVGDRYEYYLKSDPKKMHISLYRFIEHKGPDNYSVRISITTAADAKDGMDSEAIAKMLSPKLEWASGERSSTGKVNDAYSAYRLSKDEAISIMKKFVVLTNKIK
jgi:hypothetical protein